MNTKKELKDQGIILPPKAVIGEGHLDIDCPKPYCQEARKIAGADPTPLRINFVSPNYTTWKCHSCLWSGHIGELEKIEPAPIPPLEEPMGDYSLLNLPPNTPSIILTQRSADAALLNKLGFSSVYALPQSSGEPEYDERGYPIEQDAFWYVAGLADRLRTVNKLVFAFDDTPEALAIRQELARRISPAKCHVAPMTKGSLARTYAECGTDDVCADINEAKPLPIFGLYTVDDFEKELIAYFDTGMSAGVSTGWPNVDKLYTVMPSQLTVVTGIPNSGKSEWVDALTFNLALNEGWTFAAFSPENGKEAHATKLIEKRVEMSADPKSKNRMSLDTFYSGSLWVRKHYTFIESRDDTPTLDWVLERAVDAALRYGIKGLVIDPWNRIQKVMDNHKSETDYVAYALPKILQFAQNYGVHVWLVVHPKQQQPDAKTGKLRAPSLYDMAGSAHFVNMADNGIVVHRSDAIDDTSEIHVKKVRFKHIGKRGETKLSYDVVSGRYTPLDMSPTYSMLNKDDSEAIQTFEVI